MDGGFCNNSPWLLLRGKSAKTETFKDGALPGVIVGRALFLTLKPFPRSGIFKESITIE